MGFWERMSKVQQCGKPPNSYPLTQATRLESIKSSSGCPKPRNITSRGSGFNFNISKRPLRCQHESSRGAISEASRLPDNAQAPALFFLVAQVRAPAAHGSPVLRAEFVAPGENFPQPH